MGLYKGGFMTGVDFTYTVGLDAKTDTLTKKVNAFRETLAGRPFDIKLDLKGFDTDKATQAFAQLGIEMDKIKTVTADVVTLVDKNGKIYQEAKGYTAQYTDELGRMTTAYMKIPTTIGDTAKKTKEYDAILKSTADTLNRTQNVNETHRQGIEKTADEIKDSISSWKQLAEQYGASSPQAKELETKITGLVGTLKQQEGATKTAANAMQNFGTRMANAIKQTFAYGLSMRALRMAQQKVNEAFKYTIALNTEMTKIQVLQVEGAKTTEQIDNLANAFNRLAQEMGATTLQVAEGSVEWLRQGKTIEETSRLLKSTIMLSKLGDLEAGDATKYLTSTLNGYKMEAEDATSVVDKLVAVDNVAATSVRELATALQYSAAIANQTGVSFEQLVSYIGVVSETTRQNAESIGQGMKTMLTRMQDIKAGKIDEDGLGINNVEIALDKANIKLRESDSEFRDFGTVLEELAGQWGTLTGTEQAFIAKSIAGIRQVNMFTVLMQNMGRALELQEVQMNASGLAATRYKIHMESLEAKMAQLKASLENLYKELISSEFVAGLLDTGKKILDFLGNIDNLVSTIKLLAIAFATIKFTGFINGLIASVTAMNAAAIAAGTASTAMLSLGAAMTAAQPWILLAVAIGGAIAMLVSLRNEANESAKAVQDALDSISESQGKIDNFSEQKKNAGKLKSEYSALTQELKNLNPVSTEYMETQKELFNVQNQLIEILPALEGYYDSEGRFVIKNAEAIQKEIDLLQRKIELEERLQQITAGEALFDSEDTGDQWERYPDVENFTDAYIRFLEAKVAYDKATKDGGVPDAALEKEYAESKLAVLNENVKVTDLLKTASEEDAEAYIKGFMGAVNAKIPQMNLAATDDLLEAVGGSFTNFSKAGETNQLQDLILESLDIFETQLSSRTDELKKTAEEYRQEQIDLLTGASGETPGGYTEVQAGNALDYGTGASHELLENMVNVLIPKFKEGFSDVQAAMNSVAQGELIPQSEIDKLAEYGVKVLVASDGTQSLVELAPYLEDGTEKVVDAQTNQIDVMLEYIKTQFKMSEATEEVVRKILEQMYVEEALANSYDSLDDSISSISDAQEEFAENGYVSASTAAELVSVNENLASSLTRSGDGFLFNADAALQTEGAVIAAILAEAELTDAAYQVQGGMFAAAAAMLAEKFAAENLDMSLVPLIEKLEQLGAIQDKIVGGYSGGSGGSSAKQEDPRIKENEELIEQIEDQIELEEDKIDVYKEEIDLIKKAQDEYHDWIDQKKKSLELTKEESDYFKEQQKSLKELADIRKEIALLELDTSEEATAKRLELEAQAAEMEAEIAEDAEERRFDLQMEALDKLKDSFDKMIETQIEGIENVIKSIEDGIDILRDRIEDIRDLISDIRDEGRSGSSNGGSPDYTPPGDSKTITEIIAENKTVVTNTGDPEDWGWMTEADPYVTQDAHIGGGIDTRVIGENGTLQNVNAMKSGEVIYSGNPGNGWGNTVAVQTPDGEIYFISHNAQNYVEKGDIVNKGQALGLGGNTGDSRGAHAHTQIWKEIDGEWQQIDAELELFGERVGVGSQIFDEGTAAVANIVKEVIPNLSDSLDKSSIIIKTASGAFANISTDIANEFIDLGATTAEEMADIIALTNGGHIDWNNSISDITNRLNDFGYSIGLTGMELAAFIDYMRDLQGAKATAVVIPSEILDLKNSNVNPNPKKDNPIGQYAFHSGGLALPDGRSDFIGNLRSNEVFAKLLKGEYVSTEGQMDNFLKNVLPKVTLGYQAITKNNQIPSITVNMPITVEGNMDKDVIPDIKKISNNVMEEINRSLILRGYVRPANNTLS